MAGFLTTLMVPTTIDTSGLAANSSISFFQAQRIDLTAAESATLNVRLHSRTMQANDSLDVDLFPDGHTPDDPGVDFTIGSAQTLANANFVSGATVPDLKPIQVLQQFGGLVTLRLKFTRGALTGAFVMRISVDLYMKTGGDLRGNVQREWGTYLGYGRTAR